MDEPIGLYGIQSLVFIKKSCLLLKENNTQNAKDKRESNNVAIYIIVVEESKEKCNAK